MIPILRYIGNFATFVNRTVLKVSTHTHDMHVENQEDIKWTDNVRANCYLVFSDFVCSTRAEPKSLRDVFIWNQKFVHAGVTSGLVHVL